MVSSYFVRRRKYSNFSVACKNVASYMSRFCLTSMRFAICFCMLKTIKTFQSLFQHCVTWCSVHWDFQVGWPVKFWNWPTHAHKYFECFRALWLHKHHQSREQFVSQMLNFWLRCLESTMHPKKSRNIVHMSTFFFFLQTTDLKTSAPYICLCILQIIYSSIVSLDVHVPHTYTHRQVFAWEYGGTGHY